MRAVQLAAVGGCAPCSWARCSSCSSRGRQTPAAGHAAARWSPVRCCQMRGSEVTTSDQKFSTLWHQLYQLKLHVSTHGRSIKFRSAHPWLQSEHCIVAAAAVHQPPGSCPSAVWLLGRHPTACRPCSGICQAHAVCTNTAICELLASDAMVGHTGGM